jgi:hypothetical protein
MPSAGVIALPRGFSRHSGRVFECVPPANLEAREDPSSEIAQREQNVPPG